MTAATLSLGPAWTAAVAIGCPVCAYVAGRLCDRIRTRHTTTTETS